MKNKELITNEINSDYRAVTLAADMIDSAVAEADKIELIPVGADRRAFAKDVSTSFRYFSEKRRQERIRIQVNREGLYDMLPEGLFHRPPRGSASMDEEGMIKDIRNRREEEKQARLFFSPFDAEFYHVRVMTERYENRLDQKTSFNDLNQIFAFGWDEFSLLTKEQSIIWMHLLPEIQSKRNDLQFISKILTALFGLTVTLTDATAFAKPVKIETAMQMELGRGSLGIDTIVGDNFMPENDFIKISVGPATPGELISFMPGNKNREILNMSINYLVPVDTEVQIDLLIDNQFQESVLSQQSESAYLGYTVFL